MSAPLALIRVLDADDAAVNVCKLFETVFGHSMPEVQWRWKYAQAPSLGHVHVVALCPLSGQMLGHAGAVIFAGTYEKKPLRMAQVSDVMVHPQFRSDMGPDNLYRRLMQGLQQALLLQKPHEWPLYVYGFPGERPARLGERMGFYRRLYICAQYDFSSDSQYGWKRLGPWRQHVRKIDSQAWPIQLLDELCETNESHALGPALRKTAAYLQWRYQQHPLQPYTLWILGQGSKDCGWFITRQEPSATVIDASLPQSIKHRWGPTLEGWVAALAQASGCERWTTWIASKKTVNKNTPIVAVEILGDKFHSDWKMPRFQPGDTDVF